ncbi:hypothetical protein [Burkholderia sp. AU45388]|uniref:hypothetical protein n=1 Tax=Burkholderia sp. AU45388 TaxID=3059206 RepID=UPI00264C53A0|nr:hypothetical protein [Burkholderia sp. AU45388]MDN7426610.1 hypothetical protein [Burkholderia sp. AU45388]
MTGSACFVRAAAQASRFDPMAVTAHRDARLPPPVDRSIHQSAPTDILAAPEKKKAPEGAFNMLRLVRQAD